MASQNQVNPIISVGESLFDSRKKASFYLWAIGGIPIILTSFQAVFILLGTTAVDTPLIGPLAEFLRSFDLLNQVAIIFYNSSTLIVFLFIVITAAWIGQGISLRNEADRSIVYGTASSAALFFFLLFWGVYWPLSPISDSQLAMAPRLIFFLVPVVSSGCVLTAARLNPDMANEIAAILGEAEEEVESYRSSFKLEREERISERTLQQLSAGEFESLQDSNLNEDPGDYISIGVEEEKQIIEDRKQRLDEIENNIQDIRQFEEASDAVLEDAKQVRSSVRTLSSAEDVVDQIESSLRGKLKDNIEAILRSELRDFKSHYQNSYDMKGLDTNQRTVDLVHIDGQTMLTNSANYFGDKLESNDIDIALLIKDFQRVLQQIKDVGETIEQQNDSLEQRVGEINDSLSVVDDQLEIIDERTRPEIKKIFVDGNIEDVDVISISSVHDLIEDAKNHHYNCEFDKQEKKLDTASQQSAALTNIMEFISTITNAASTAEDIQKFAIPSFDQVDSKALPDTVLETLDIEFQSRYDTKLDHDANSVQIIPETDTSKQDSEPKQESMSGTDREGVVHSNTETDSDEITEGAVIDGVSMLLSHAEKKAGELDRSQEVGEDHLSLTPTDLPPLATESEVTERFRSILSEHPDVKSIETDQEGSKSIITISLHENNINVQDVIVDARRRFNNE